MAKFLKVHDLNDAQEIFIKIKDINCIKQSYRASTIKYTVNGDILSIDVIESIKDLEELLVDAGSTVYYSDKLEDPKNK